MKYVFIDMDGVIAEYGYPNGLYDGDFQKGNYVGKKPVIGVINEILRRYNNENYILMVCSASPNTKATLEKHDWLNNNFAIPYENRIFISKEEDKVEVVRYYIEDMMHGRVQEHALIIDDKGSVLAKAHSLGIECYHPTQILATIPVVNAEESTPEVETPIEEVPTEETSEVIDATNDDVNEIPVLTVDNSEVEGQMSIDDIV